MASATTRSFHPLTRLARRFAGQALLSGSVMIALNAASHIDLGLGDAVWPGFAEEAAQSEPQREAMVLPGLGTGVMRASDTETTPIMTASVSKPVREARLPVPARVFGPVAEMQAEAEAKPAAARTSPPVRLASFDAARKDGVLLFDQCAPACESRDPLLHRSIAKAARRPATPARTRLADLEASAREIVADAETQGPARPAWQPAEAAPGLLTRSLSAAWDTGHAAAGSLARLVNW
ncbi:hypothetical protein NS365_09420 [Aureimonas ureilytica]|uniref:Uncharacterized protein n=1 Tax=Aureimonas ureilytica TaxID=401562 RepID=A0A175RR91_9HYPH|nr:hypothetical protein [Aureimonas ureilytica]KTR05997.1 hypothetical protein NS365_09420 [Aureimonas ureilytica]